MANKNVTSIESIAGLIAGSEISGKVLIDIAREANMKLFRIASNNKNRGYGWEVVQRIDGLSDAELHEINQAASQEVFLRTVGKGIEATRKNAQVLEFAPRKVARPSASKAL